MTPVKTQSSPGNSFIAVKINIKKKIYSVLYIVVIFLKNHQLIGKKYSSLKHLGIQNTKNTI